MPDSHLLQSTSLRRNNICGRFNAVSINISYNT